MRFTKRSDVRRSNSDYTCRGPALAKVWQITHSDISICRQKLSAGGVPLTKIWAIIYLFGLMALHVVGDQITKDTDRYPRDHHCYSDNNETG